MTFAKKEHWSKYKKNLAIVIPRVLCVTIYGSVSVEGRSSKLKLTLGKSAFSLIWDVNGWFDGNFNGIW